MKDLRNYFLDLQSELKGINWPLAVLLIFLAAFLACVLPAPAKGTAIAGTVALFVALVVYPWGSVAQIG